VRLPNIAWNSSSNFSPHFYTVLPLVIFLSYPTYMEPSYVLWSLLVFYCSFVFPSYPPGLYHHVGFNIWIIFEEGI
jgi:hypothetical protein